MFLALVGVVRPIMEALAPPERFEAIARNYPSFEADAVRVLIVALAAAAGCWRLSLRQWRTAALAGIVVLDLWSVERRFIQWSPPAAEAFAADGVVGRLEKDPGHYRVLGLGLYLDTYLMDHGIRSVLGYHGNELHSYDELLGGKNIWKNAGSPNLWKLLAVKYIVVPDSVQVPGLVSEGGRLDAHGGQPAFLYRVQEASPFAFLVRQAVKLPEEQIVSTLMDRRFDPHRLLLLPPNAPAGVTNLSALPDSMPGKVTVEEPRAGKFRLTLETPPAEPAYLFLAENYFPDWRAEVDGQVAPVLRAQYTLMAVPLAAGSKVVTLEFHSDWDALGRWVSLVVTVGLLAIGGAGLVFRRRVAGD
jgi:hypothetical protein